MKKLTRTHHIVVTVTTDRPFNSEVVAADLLIDIQAHSIAAPEDPVMGYRIETAEAEALPF
jgi:hypothetical protein